MALHEMNGAVINGRTIKVSHANNKKQQLANQQAATTNVQNLSSSETDNTTLFIGSLSTHTTEQELQ